MKKLINQFDSRFRSLEELRVNRRTSLFFVNVNLAEIVMCLEDLINYFVQPEDDMGKN